MLSSLSLWGKCTRRDDVYLRFFVCLGACSLRNLDFLCAGDIYEMPSLLCVLLEGGKYYYKVFGAFGCVVRASMMMMLDRVTVQD
jgi:hypothetical protein